MKNKKKNILLLIVLVLLFSIVGGTHVYAKYYSAKAKEGIAIATGVYFTANYAVSTTEDGEFVESLVSNTYQGTDTSFIFEIRNYENNLLYNIANVDIPYEIKFWMGEDIADGTIYSVSCDNGLTQNTLTTNEYVIRNQSIEGGFAKANEYLITVDVPDNTVHESVPVYVQVNTLEGSLINCVLKGKMILGSRDVAASYIESQKFIVEDEHLGMTDAQKFEKLKASAGFVYEIRTVGEVMNGETTEELKLSWDPDILQIDMFDKAYTEWYTNAKQTDPSISGPIVEGDRQYITIKIMPYSAETIVFFRGTGFEASEAAGTLNWESLHEAITAEKIVN